MFTTIDVHFHPDDTVAEINESGNGLTFHEPGSFDPRLNLFLGSDPYEISENVTILTEKLQELRLHALRAIRESVR